MRRTIPILPEPVGVREGKTGIGKPLRLLVLGDSAAAGVGVSSMDDSLTPQLVGLLKSRYGVQWKVLARTGATTASTMRALDKLKLSSFDLCLTSLGVNDVTSGVTTEAWIAQQFRLRQRIRSELQVNHLIVCGLPPMHRFPALPQPLRWWLGAKATEFNEKLQQSISSEADVSFLSLRFSDDPELLATDGMHPGPTMYREWACRAAELICRHDAE